MGERLLLLGKEVAVGVLTADVGKLVDSVVDLALSVKHCKSKCQALADKVRLVNSAVQKVEEQRQKCSDLSDCPRFSLAEYGEAVVKFLQVVGDSKDVLRRYKNKSAFIRVFSSYWLEDEFDALDKRLETCREYFSFGLLVRVTTLSYDQRDDMQEMRHTMSQTLQAIQSILKEERLDIPEESLMLQSITLNDQDDLYGGYMLQGRLQHDGEECVDVILVASTQEKKEAAIARLLTDCPPLLRFLGRYNKDGMSYAVVERPATEIVTLDEAICGFEGVPARYRVLPSDWRLKKMIAYEIALGVRHAHNAGVLHRNLRSSNVFLTDECEPKLFGFLQGRIKAEKSDKRFNNSEQVRWAAPEMLQKGRPEFNEKCDIFSLGVIMWELITNEYPFTDAKTSVKVISERTKSRKSLQFPAEPSTTTSFANSFKSL